MVLPRLALATAAVVAAATAVHVGTATLPSAELPAGLAVSARPAPKGVAQLYELHCAQCHGEKGDGDGVTELERPARSFVEGGYIYGNTIAAVTRTLRRGIPGSAMPSFVDSLTEHERSLLARHVLSLGPDGTDAASAECLVPTSTVPEVLDGPLMAPGQPLSAPVGDVGLHASRLLTFPGAPSVQFARGSWTLVAIRAEGSVRRDDWRRGGRSITARGEVLWSLSSTEAVDPGGLVALESGAPLERRLRRTQLGPEVITQEFSVEAGSISARLGERVATIDIDGAAAVVRVLGLSGDDGVAFTALSPGVAATSAEPAGAVTAFEGDGWWAVDGDERRRVIIYPLGAPPSGDRVRRAAREHLERVQ